MNTLDLDTLQARCRELRDKLDLALRDQKRGLIEYEELARAAKAFCLAFDAYQFAKAGKRRRTDWRAVIR